MGSQANRKGKFPDIIQFFYISILPARVHPVTEGQPQRKVPELSGFGPISWLFACIISAIEL